MALLAEREILYQRLEKVIGKTPLSEIQILDIPNRCRIFAKEEYRNPTGSHYDRQTLRLIRESESEGKIAPGRSKILESTTGSSGASFAWMCRVLGYKAVVVIPKDMPTARIEQIRSYGASVELSPKDKYIEGIISTFSRFAASHRKDHYPLNHAFDEKHSVQAMRELGEEILSDFAELRLGPGYFVSALGNGISARGIGEALAVRGVKLYGMEPHESPTVYFNYFKEEYEKKFGRRTLQFTPHIIYGTGPGKQLFPNIKSIGPKLSGVFHPTRRDVLDMRERLMFNELQLVGNSSAGCLWAAMKLAEEVPARSMIVTIFYDAAWRYLPFGP
jgi:cysteine synthase